MTDIKTLIAISNMPERNQTVINTGFLGKGTAVQAATIFIIAKGSITASYRTEYTYILPL